MPRDLKKSLGKNFRPQVAVGVGGYASGPTLKTAGMMGVPTLIQEQNSYAGVTNKLLAQKARKICVAYDGMEKFFPADKIIMTGNPVRQNLTKDMPSKEEALGSFHLQPGKKRISASGRSSIIAFAIETAGKICPPVPRHRLPPNRQHRF